MLGSRAVRTGPRWLAPAQTLLMSGCLLSSYVFEKALGNLLLGHNCCVCVHF